MEWLVNAMKTDTSSFHVTNKYVLLWETSYIDTLQNPNCKRCRFSLIFRICTLIITQSTRCGGGEGESVLDGAAAPLCPFLITISAPGVYSGFSHIQLLCLLSMEREKERELRIFHIPKGREPELHPFLMVLEPFFYLFLVRVHSPEP